MGKSRSPGPQTATPEVAGAGPENTSPDMGLMGGLSPEYASMLGGSFGSDFLRAIMGGGEEKSKKPFERAASGTQTIYTPKVGGNGKTLYFFFGYTGSKKDQAMLDQEDQYLTDDIFAAIRQGFTVVYDTAGTRTSFLAAVYDATCYGVYWSGHGGSGGIQGSDGSWITHSDVDASKVGGGCQYLILAACQSGTAEAGWKKAMGSQCKFQGWVPLTNTGETIDFTDSAAVGDSWWGHGGVDESMELRDYINHAGQQVAD